MTPHSFFLSYDFPAQEPKCQRRNDPRLSWKRSAPDLGDPHGLPRAARLPSPLTAAEGFARPLLEERFGPIVRRPGGRLIITTDGSRLEPSTARDTIVEALTGSSPATGDPQPFSALDALQRLAASDPAYVVRYARAIASVLGRVGVFPEEETTRPPAPLTPRKTAAEHSKDYRARQRDAQERSARAWLLAIAPQRRPGEQFTPERLHRAAIKYIDAHLGEFLPDDPEHVWATPGKQAFYRVADHVLGGRTRTSAIRLYTIPENVNTEPLPQATPEEQPVNTSEVLALADAYRELADARACANEEHRAELELFERQRAAIASGDRFGALTAQRERLARSAPGIVIDAAERFGRAAA